MEATVLTAILADPTWLARARDLVPLDRMELPAHQEIYRALLGAPAGQPLGGVADALPDETRRVWVALLDSAAQRRGDYKWDEAFLGAVEALEARALERRLEAIADPEERARQRRALSPTAQARHPFLKQAARLRRSPTARPPRADSPPEE
jgi:hypothetical protein